MTGICCECNDGKEKRLAKRNPPLCGYHYAIEQRKKSAEKNKDKPKKAQKPLKKMALTYKRKATGELQMFEVIWDNMGMKHKSFISGEEIKVFNVRNFAHVLPKAQNRYPKFKLNPENVVLLTYDEHFLWDNGSREKLRHLPEWKKMFELEAELKKQYEELERGHIMLQNKTTTELNVTLFGVVIDKLKNIANDYGVKLVKVEKGDKHYSINPDDIYINRSYIIGDEIYLGIYESDDLMIASFFHELGHMVDAKEGGYNSEIKAWLVGFKVAEKYGYKFSDKVYIWAIEQLFTYADDEGRHKL